MLEFWS